MYQAFHFTVEAFEAGWVWLLLGESVLNPSDGFLLLLPGNDFHNLLLNIPRDWDEVDQPVIPWVLLPTLFGGFFLWPFAVLLILYTYLGHQDFSNVIECGLKMTSTISLSTCVDPVRPMVLCSVCLSIPWPRPLPPRMHFPCFRLGTGIHACEVVMFNMMSPHVF